MRRSAVLGAVVLAVGGCSSSGTVPQPAPARPVQDVTLDGTPQLHLTLADSPLGVLDTAPPSPDPRPATGCWEWTDTDRVPHWAARIAGTADGHTVVLTLEVDAQSTAPLGTHPTSGAVSPSGSATLTVDGARFPGVHVDQADAQPSYFTLDNDGSTGLLSIRFATTSGGPQAYYAVGRWRCAANQR